MTFRATFNNTADRQTDIKLFMFTKLQADS